MRPLRSKTKVLADEYKIESPLLIYWIRKIIFLVISPLRSFPLSTLWRGLRLAATPLCVEEVILLNFIFIKLWKIHYKI
jgi:hypothetical protein